MGFNSAFKGLNSVLGGGRGVRGQVFSLAGFCQEKGFVVRIESDAG